MKALRLLTILAVCCASVPMTLTAWAAEPAPAKPATPPAASTTAKPTESAAAKADEQSAAAQPSATAKGTQGQEDEAAAKPKASGKGSPERFVPSEQVRADFDVSFPIDI